jgi:hypothetical protein
MPITPTLKYQYGATSPVIAPVATATDVEVGDATAFSSGNIIQAESQTWETGITTAAPTGANGAVAIGTGLTNAATGFKVSFNFPWGEGTLSAAGSATPTAGAAIVLAAVALPTYAISRNIYVETAAASGTYKLFGVDQGAQFFITGYGFGRTPPTAVLQDATTLTQYAFAKSFAGISGCIKAANVARVSGFSTDNLIRVDPAGVFTAPITSTTLAVGDYVNMAKNTGANTLENQTVAKVAAVGDPLGHMLAIGVVVEAGTSLTTAKFALLEKTTNSY